MKAAFLIFIGFVVFRFIFWRDDPIQNDYKGEL